MKVGFLQFNPLFGKKPANFKRVKELLKGMKSDIIVLPELFNTGYTFLNKRELIELAEKPKGDTADFVLSLAREMNCCFAYGFAEKDKNIFYNSMALMTPNGLIGIYRKSHLFLEEKNFFKPGDTGFKIFDYKKVKIGMLICFDWIYPEAMRTLALKGAQIILHSANLVMSHCPDAMVTRALENQVFIVTANRVGKDKRDGKEYKFIGNSEIVSPKGKVLIRVGKKECARTFDIDPTLALNKKVTRLNDLFVDRREDLYFK